MRGVVDQVLDDVVRRLDRTPGLRTRVRHGLLIGCFVLFAGYLAWYVRRRRRQWDRPGEGFEAGEGDTVRRFALIGVCIALLVATPASLLADHESLVEATVDAIRDFEPASATDSTVDSLLTHAIHSQYEMQGSLRVLAGIRESTTVQGMLGGFAQRLDLLADSTHRALRGFSTRLGALGYTIDSVRQEAGNQRDTVAGLQRSTLQLRQLLGDLRDSLRELTNQADTDRALVDDLRRRIDTVASVAASANGRLRDLEKQIAGLTRTEELLVQTVPSVRYAIARTAGGQVVDSGQGQGIHRLPTGSYLVISGNGRDTVTLQAGRPRWVVVYRPQVVQ